MQWRHPCWWFTYLRALRQVRRRPYYFCHHHHGRDRLTLRGCRHRKLSFPRIQIFLSSSCHLQIISSTVSQLFPPSDKPRHRNLGHLHSCRRSQRNCQIFRELVPQGPGRVGMVSRMTSGLEYCVGLRNYLDESDPDRVQQSRILDCHLHSPLILEGHHRQ